MDHPLRGKPDLADLRTDLRLEVVVHNPDFERIIKREVEPRPEPCKRNSIEPEIFARALGQEEAVSAQHKFFRDLE